MTDVDKVKELLSVMINIVVKANWDIVQFQQYFNIDTRQKAESYKIFISKFIEELYEIEGNIENNIENKFVTSRIIKTPHFSSHAGVSIFKIYKRLRDKIEKGLLITSVPDLEKLPEFIDFLRMFEQLTLVFTTKIDDLIGCGSRGASSCQSFFGSSDPTKARANEYNISTIGLALSKYTGIIYLTPGRSYKNLGEKMTVRSLVRIVYNTETDEPIIIVEKVYPAGHTNSEYIQDFY